MSGLGEKFRAAVEAGDIAAALDLFAEDVTFNSPVVHKPYRGKAPLGAILHAVFSVFENFRYVAEYGGDDGHVLRFTASVRDADGRDLALEGVDIVHGTETEITELTVLVRPYSAATALRARMAALLAS